MRRTFAIVLVALSAVALPACDDDPVASTGTIVIQLSGINEGDIRSGVVENSKNVTTETGNPYRIFLDEARTVLGRPPGRIRVTSASITIDGSSRGVASLADLFTGEVNVFLDANVGGTVPVARTTDPAGMGPVAFRIVAGDDDLAPIMTALLAGDFRVGVNGPTPRLPSDDFDARLDVRIGFSAYP